MDNEPGKIKGLILIGVKKWLLESYGEARFNQFLGKLPDDERNIWVKQDFLPSSLLPASYYRHMYDAIMSVWAPRGREVFQEGAAAVAFYDISRVFKIIMKISTPSFVASRFPIVMNQYFTSGDFKITRSDPKGFEAELSGAEIYGIAGCEGVMGWARRALIQTGGATNLEIIHNECLFKGGKICKFTFKWD